jgi:ribonuclease PH
MWRDIGLGDWLFDLDDEADVRRVPDAVVEMAKNPVESRQLAAKARHFVEERQRAAMRMIAKQLADEEGQHGSDAIDPSRQGAS